MNTSPLRPNSNSAASARTAGSRTVLEVQDLWVQAVTRGGTSRPLVMGCSLSVGAGEIVAVVGESGSGKSTICRAVTRLLDPGVAATGGNVRINGTEMLQASESDLRRIRGRVVGMVFQDPIASMNPVRSIGFQLSEARQRHGIARGAELKEWTRKTLSGLGFEDPDHAMGSFPVAFSGGMLQRIGVGMAFSADPVLVIADEPTTALDVSLQGRVLRLLIGYAKENSTAVLIVSHDISLVRALAQRVVVMYGGRVLESGPTSEVFSKPASPYTKALLDSVPSMTPENRARPLPTIPVAEGSVEPGVDACPFVSRCSRATADCRSAFPGSTVVDVTTGHTTWCFNPVQMPDT